MIYQKIFKHLYIWKLQTLSFMNLESLEHFSFKGNGLKSIDNI